MDVNKSLEQIQKYAQSTYNGTIIVMVEELCLLLKHLSKETKVCNCKPEVSVEEKPKLKAGGNVKSKTPKTKSSKVKKDGI